MTRSPLALASLAFVLGAAAAADATEAPSIATIMSRDFVGTSPTSPRWSDDGRALLYELRRPGTELVDTWRVDVASGESSRLEGRELAAADPAEAAYSRDRRLKAYVRAGDLFLRDTRSGKLRQITRTGERESEPLVLNDGRVAFRRGDAYRAFDPASGLTSTLAELRLADDPDAETPEGFYAEQQQRYFETLRGRKERRDAAKALAKERRAADPSAPPEPWYLGKGKALQASALSPDGARLVVVLGPERDASEESEQGADGGKPDKMPRFVTASGYVEVSDVRPKVGTGKPETPTVALLDLTSRERHELDLAVLPGLREDPLAGLRAAAAAAKPAAPADAAAPKAPAEPQPRVVSVGQLAWSDDGRKLALQLFSYDNKDRWIAVADGAAGKLEPLERIHDPAWIGWSFNQLGWMRDGATLWYLSEESGFSQLYLRPLAGRKRQLTQGRFEIDAPQLARDGKSFFVVANREHPGIFEAYRVDAASGALTRLSERGGLIESLVVSPDEKQIAYLASAITEPNQLWTQPARAGAAAKRLTDTVSPAFRAVDWSRPEIVAVPSTHGAGQIWARVYTPPGWTPAGRYPAVAFVHGAGYLQNVHHGWSSYFREFMFHTLLTRRGYVVIDMDYRASSGYGRDWRTAIYRQMGWPEVEDYADGLAWLVANKAVDPARVGVYGGSYGGFFTFMALFTRPELFAAGAALRPVTDWAHYNHGYTSNILNTPEVDPEAYRKSSPIEYAEGLAKPLLILHGMVDDNVTFQDSVRLVQRLIELGKTDLFETAIYPVESHAFVEPSSWTDEYRRIWNLFERTLWE
ncbi:MAG: prolyl oligopeptidase family serine peptidase [Thermoanaerobaculia bacterium]|nr:prolyl oligopeptidase family serine peptidase [Thermoanaerobaculia bacterium]